MAQITSCARWKLRRRHIWEFKNMFLFLSVILFDKEFVWNGGFEILSLINKLLRLASSYLRTFAINMRLCLATNVISLYTSSTCVSVWPYYTRQFSLQLATQLTNEKHCKLQRGCYTFAIFFFATRYAPFSGCHLEISHEWRTRSDWLILTKLRCKLPIDVSHAATFLSTLRKELRKVEDSSTFLTTRNAGCKNGVFYTCNFFGNWQCNVCCVAREIASCKARQFYCFSNLAKLLLVGFYPFMSFWRNLLIVLSSHHFVLRPISYPESTVSSVSGSSPG